MASAEFDLRALYDALNEARVARDLSWAALTSEINSQFSEVVGTRSIAPSTITGLATRTVAEGDGVLQMLRWLVRSPESFLGDASGDVAGRRLPDLPPNRILRWDTAAIHRALDERRRALGLSWKQVAEEIGGLQAASLIRLKAGGRTAFPGVMRIVQWLERPAADFTRASER